MRKSLIIILITLALSIVQCTSWAQVGGIGLSKSTLVWNEGDGAESYKVTWYPTNSPGDIQSMSGVYGTRYEFDETAFTANVQYTIEVRSVNCCGEESEPAVIKYYKKVGSGGECCMRSVVKDSNSECWVEVTGMSWFRPGGVVAEGCQ